MYSYLLSQCLPSDRPCVNYGTYRRDTAPPSPGGAHRTELWNNTTTQQRHIRGDLKSREVRPLNGQIKGAKAFIRRKNN